ncbi:hypothetical protein Tco_0538039 [Tanacetum coccineum]
MHNNIMAAGSKERPPMLGPGRYSQWRSRFLRYLDTKSNGEYLRKCIFEGTDITQKDEKQSQNDKTEHGMEKTVKDKAKSKPKNQSSQKVNRKVNWSKSKSTPTWSNQKKVKEEKI